MNRKIPLLLFSVLLFSMLVGIPSKMQSTEIGSKNKANLADYAHHDVIEINGNEEFQTMATSEAWTGTGTLADPIIISGYFFNDSSTQPIRIFDTTLYFIISNCLVNGSYDMCGIYFNGVSNGKIITTEVYNRNSGIVVSNCENITVQLCNVYNNSAHGVKIDLTSEHVIIRDSYIENNGGSGIIASNSNKISIVDNEILNSTENGIHLSMCSDIEIARSEISESSGDGVNITGGARVDINNCAIEYNERNGVSLYSVNNSSVFRNLISRNSPYGVSLTGTTENATISWNTFIQNSGTSQCYDDGLNNVFMLNFYSTWIAPDLNNDDIVDNPYPINGAANNQDPYPRTSPDAEPTIPSGGIDPLAIGVIGLVLLAVLIFVIQSKNMFKEEA